MCNYKCKTVKVKKGDGNELYTFLEYDGFSIKGSINWAKNGKISGMTLTCDFMKIIAIYYCKDRNHIQIRGIDGDTNIATSFDFLSGAIKEFCSDRIYPILFDKEEKCKIKGCLDRSADQPHTNNGNILD